MDTTGRRSGPFQGLRDAEAFTGFGANYLPGYLGIEIVSIDPTGVRCRTPVRTELLAPNGYLHAGTVVNLPEGAGRRIALFRCTQMILWN